MKFQVVGSEFEAIRLFGYIKNVTKNFNDPMFSKLELNIDENFYNKIKKSDFNEMGDEFIETIKFSSKNLRDVKESIPKLRVEWRKIEKKLFETIKEVTCHKVEGNFVCHLLTKYRSGGYDGENNLWIYYLGIEKTLWGITHELLHIHCWKIWDRLFMNYEWDEAWKFSEVYVELLLRDSKISFIIPEEERKIKFWEEVEPIAKKVLPLWKKRENFESFLIDSFKELKMKGNIINI
jgi:hypothetical protein